MYRPSLSSMLTAAALTGSASAQSFNIDVSDLSGSPSNTYGAASGQVGTWNVLTGGPPYFANLVDTAGGATTVTTNVAAFGNGPGDFSFDNAGTAGDDEFLMDDGQDVGNGASTTTWTFSGLNPVDYEIYVYAWAPDLALAISSVSECGSGTSFLCGGSWPGGFVEGVTHVRVAAHASNGTIELCVESFSGNFATVNGFQFIETGGGGPGTPLCFGDGSGGTCPCFNTGGAGEGCQNSTGSGAILSGTGTASVSNNTAELVVDNYIPGQPGLFFQGDNLLNGGNGFTFGDGLRCCGVNVQRFGVVYPGATWRRLFVTGAASSSDSYHFAIGSSSVDLQVSAGQSALATAAQLAAGIVASTGYTATYTQAGDEGQVTLQANVSVSVEGSPPIPPEVTVNGQTFDGATFTVGNRQEIPAAPAGDTRCYQFWYRDPAGSPCGSGFNLSNAYSITWAP